MEWYNDQHHAVYVRFEGKWTWDDLSNMVKSVGELAETVSWDICVLVDLNQSNYLPGGNVMQQGRANLKYSPENLTQFVFVIESQLLKTFTSTVFSFSPKWRSQTRFVKTLQEGRDIIDKLVVEPISTG
jgi:hypothetical protein